MNISQQPEIIDIGNLTSETPVITLNKRDNINLEPTVSSKNDLPSVNFGSGIELLMNEKRKSDGTKTPISEVNLGDINDLEKELNSLTSGAPETKSIPRQSKSGLFNNSISPTTA